jgi:hypothetical protein
MPKKTNPPMTQAEQSKRFLEAAHDIEVDGGLNPTEAVEVMERALFRAAPLKLKADYPV